MSASRLMGAFLILVGSVACSSTDNGSPAAGAGSSFGGAVNGAGTGGGVQAGAAGLSFAGAGGQLFPGAGASTGGASGFGTGGANTAGTSAGGMSSGGMTANGGATQMECGWTPGYTGALLGRCNATSCTNGMCGQTKAKGGFLTLDDFEGAAIAAPPIPVHWPARDGRVGSWAKYADAASNTTLSTTGAGGGGSPDSKQALHFVGGVAPWGASAALPIASCYDASAYRGISFWLKGNPGAGNTTIKINLQTPPTEPVASGGTCTGGCSDHFGKIVTVPSTWTRVKVPWADLKRGCGATTPPIPTNFEPQKMILALSFQQVDPAKAFDYYIDDITFDIEDKSANNIGEILIEPTFNEMFKTALPVFNYSSLISAAGTYGQGTFAQAGSSLDRKHEVAAFLAQIAHETGSLTIVREAACYPTQTGSCTVQDAYYGRGAIQLTHQANYNQANGTFPGILNTPDLVATNSAFAFGTGFWFWMSKGCHGQIMGQSFGGTTQIINGGLECGGGPANPNGAAQRANLYIQMCAALGINARGTLGC